MIKKRAISALCAAVCLCMGILSGCGSSGVSLPGGKRSEKGYSLPQIQMIAATEKNRYEEICTEQIWSAEAGSGEEDFETYLKGQIQNFMDEMKVMNLLAEEREVVLSPEEQAAMTAAAEEYYGALTAEDIQRMELTQEAALELFEDYCMAEKLVAALTEGMNLEVSDSEAKVIVVQQAETPDRQTAEKLREAALEEGADFESCAAEAGIEITERSLGRKEETAEYETAAFALLTGEISPVIAQEGRYYVVKCINDYDREATAARKELIYEERRQKAFCDLYESYRQDVKITYTGAPFEVLDLTADGCAKAADFFEIYEKHMEK